jgi:hypothetical protein
MDDHQITHLTKLEKEEEDKKQVVQKLKTFRFDGPVAKFG